MTRKAFVMSVNPDKHEEYERREKGIPVNPNLERELQTMRDELGIVGYEEYF